jgi:bifunctional DNA-binding transcriptional regulator/antitoxin component of YhaV-PrlF toxin-antitoxin module
MSTTFFTSIDDEGFLTIPEEILEAQGWGEGTVLDIEIVEDDPGKIIIRESITDDGYPGCMGDILTEEEERALAEGGLEAFMRLPPPF